MSEQIFTREVNPIERHLLEQVYRQYEHEIYLYLYALCQSHETAEELVQETFLKALLSLPDRHTNVRAWLYTVGRNLCYNRLKREQSAKAYYADAEARAPDTDEPEAALLRHSRQQALLRAMGKLNPMKREVLLLRYWSGLSYQEIAALLGAPPSRLRAVACRAKKELKTIMEEYDDDLS